MNFPKPPFAFYRDCRAFGDNYNIFGLFDLSRYGTYTSYKRIGANHMGMSACFNRFQTECYWF